MTERAYRHGDMALVKIDELPDGLEVSDSKILLTGRTSTHEVNENGIFYPHEADEFIVGYLVAKKGCQLLHPEHGEGSGPKRKASIESGIYEIRRQQEHTPDGMRPVLD